MIKDVTYPTAASFDISGKITDADGTPLAGATVKLKGSESTTIADQNGKFTLSSTASSGILEISFVGYETSEISFSQGISVTVSLKRKDTKVEEIVVVGYGTQSKKLNTGATQTINANEIKDEPVSQLGQKLQGKIAGAQINLATGRPGEGVSIRIRGQASISGGFQPLYVVDGLPLTGDIANLNPDEIENISILKDAASTAIYGSRAANGVVLVTTKRARGGQTNFSVNTYTGTQSIPQQLRPELMNAKEFAQYQNEIAVQRGNTPRPYYANPDKFGEGTNWFDAVTQKAPISSISISASSNKDKFSVAAVAGYLNQEGVILNSGYKRYSLRLNTEYKFNDKVRLGFNVAPTYAVTNNSLAGGQQGNSDGVWWSGASIQTALLSDPTLPYKNPDGSLPLAANSPGGFPNANWYRTLQERYHINNNLSLLSNGFIEIEIIKGLKFKSSINLEYGQSKYDEFRPTTTGGIFNPPPTGNSGFIDNRRAYSWLFENTLDYTKSLGNHNFNILVGYTSQKTYSDRSFIYGSNYPTDLVRNIDQAANRTPGSSSSSWTIASGIARANYDYKGKYLLSGSLRRDGSSKFGAANRYAVFPAVSAGWIISEENFLKNIKAISFLKIRGSYGIVGNDAIPLFSSFSSISANNTVFDNNFTSGYSPSSLGNNQLGWEQTKQVDLGFDIGLFNNRVSLSYDYYSKQTDKLLYNVPVPAASGFNSIAYNIGTFKYWGHEISVTTRNTVNKFKWNTNFNISFNDNKVLALGNNNQPIFGEFTITKVGSRIGQFYGYVSEGLYKDAEDIAKSPIITGISVPGTVKFKDFNGDGKISINDETDKTIIGNPVPKFIYGITNTFYYNHFDLNIVASGSYGNEVFKSADEEFGNLDGVFNVYKSVARRWKSEADPGDGFWGTAGSTGNIGELDRSYKSSRWVNKASFLTIKNVALGYTLPLKQSAYVRSIRIYASVQQLFVFTNYNGSNPEVSAGFFGQQSNALSLGVDKTSYPVPRTFIIGANINF